MTNELQPSETWLSLTEAAKQFNVHPTTLRRWANNGQIPYILTPGGHRRFALSDIEAFFERQRGGGQSVPQIWADKALAHTRQEMGDYSDSSWMMAMDDHYREIHRRLGQKLLGLTLQYISGNGESEQLLEEARHIGYEYGRISQELHLPLTVPLQASLFFRDRLIEAALQLPDSTRIQSKENLYLLERINTLINTVHLAIAETYASAG